MKYFEVIVATLCLALGCSISALADPQVETGDGLAAEYEKLMRAVRVRKKPVQVIDGTLNIAGRPGIGPKDAAVILVEFGDFQCPFCRVHLLGAAQQIRKKLVAENLLRYVFLDFPIEDKHPLAAQAAAAARC